MSVDALQLAADIPGALREARRILRPGARFAFTTWEARRPFLFTLQMMYAKDHRPLLRRCGFEVES
jgi:ubiquinone/menaquinone biosynthesis C-methylase UbiE